MKSAQYIDDKMMAEAAKQAVSTIKPYTRDAAIASIYAQFQFLNGGDLYWVTTEIATAERKSSR